MSATTSGIDTVRAVHHPTRRRVIVYLNLYGATRVGTLAGELDEQVGSISHHLRILERAEIVERVPELATDGRTSWWRLTDRRISWTVDDFDDPAERVVAREAEIANFEQQLKILSAWMRSSGRAPEAWRKAAFNTSLVALATPDELNQLSEELQRTFAEWRRGIEQHSTATEKRTPVYLFAHGFPSKP